jgi:hypothetical protein
MDGKTILHVMTKGKPAMPKALMVGALADRGGATIIGANTLR